MRKNVAGEKLHKQLQPAPSGTTVDAGPPSAASDHCALPPPQATHLATTPRHHPSACSPPPGQLPHGGTQPQTQRSRGKAASPLAWAPRWMRGAWSWLQHHLVTSRCRQPALHPQHWSSPQGSGSAPVPGSHLSQNWLQGGME